MWRVRRRRRRRRRQRRRTAAPPPPRRRRRERVVGARRDGLRRSRRGSAAMIEHFHVENYRCLRDVSVDFGPLTILVGPNDSGKSTLLQALLRFSWLTRGVRAVDWAGE